MSPLDEMEYTVTLLDAEDSFDVVVTYPDNTRITVFLMAKTTYEEGRRGMKEDDWEELDAHNKTTDQERSRFQDRLR